MAQLPLLWPKFNILSKKKNNKYEFFLFIKNFTLLLDLPLSHYPRLSEEGKRINEITKVKKGRGEGQLLYERSSYCFHLFRREESHPQERLGILSPAPSLILLCY